MTYLCETRREPEGFQAFTSKKQILVKYAYLFRNIKPCEGRTVIKGSVSDKFYFRINLYCFNPCTIVKSIFRNLCSIGNSYFFDRIRNIVEIPVDQLKPYKKNARFNENAVPKVAESIKQFGFKVPIIVDKNMSVITGHTRLLASKQLGLKKVPCIIADDLTPKQVKAFRLVDNRTSEFASWNYDLLQSELETLDIDLSDFEFPDLTYEDTLSAEELESILDDDTDPTSEYGKDDDDEETDSKDFSHKDEYKVEITCKNQTEQESLYYELVKRGLNVRTY